MLTVSLLRVRPPESLLRPITLAAAILRTVPTPQRAHCTYRPQFYNMALDSEGSHKNKQQRGILGLFCGTIHVKTKGVSCIGDSSVIENDEDEGNHEVASPQQAEQVVPVAIPSPVLFSKKLAEEAVAKRNVRLRNQSTEESPAQPTSTNDASSASPPFSTTPSSPNIGQSGAAGARSRQKRMAPPPPDVQTIASSSLS